jgi:hypothetical protein
MELACTPVLLIGAVVVLVAALGVGALVLVKMGVLVKYALKEEPPEQGDYDLEQSHPVGEE